MDAIRTAIIRIADDVSLSFQNAARSFAFYSDGRDLVRLREAESTVVGEFPDHSDEGWPALHFDLPRDASFQRASSGFLTRNALFASEHTVAELEHQFTAAGLTAIDRSRSGWSAELAEGALMRVWRPRSHFGAPSPPTVILIEQRRVPDDIVQAIQSMAGRQQGSS